MSKVIVIGGGFAGLSAATALAEAGHQVTVLEGRQVLGGRAYSFTDQRTGDSVDNGQHLFMGCYRQTLAFLERIGAVELLRFQKRLSVDFVGPRQRAGLRCWPLPSPWHLYSGLARLSTLTWGDRWRLRHVRNALKRDAPEELDRLTIDHWLTRCRQSENAKRHLWNLIAIACLNEDARIASAAPFAAVLRQAFFSDNASSRLAIASVGLSDLYVRASVEYIERAGGRVRTKSPVQRLDIQDGRLQAVQLREGEGLEADWVVSAVPPWALLKLLPEAVAEGQPYFAALRNLTYAPIISIHLWFDRPITNRVFCGLLDTHIQWLFNRSKITGASNGERGHISLVISGAHAFVEWDEKRILSLATEELKRLFPEAEKAALVRTLVIKENQATLSPTIGTEAVRPVATSPIEGLLVAGDWTRTGLPATIESACVSGHACADIISRRHCEDPPSRRGGDEAISDADRSPRVPQTLGGPSR